MITIHPPVIHWHHTDRLPPEDPRFVWEAGRRAYNQAFAHRPVLEPLRDVAQRFAAERARSGSALTTA
ncbi:hypothetical protein [Kitasatospora sp. NPDC057015]|uniref:hypothetical protein n=1 Tax=Kitasatospora sp. NPDC057015 TaxID=3346001 RepID=UPI00362BFF93